MLLLPECHRGPRSSFRMRSACGRRCSTLFSVSCLPLSLYEPRDARCAVPPQQVASSEPSVDQSASFVAWSPFSRRSEADLLVVGLEGSLAMAARGSVAEERSASVGEDSVGPWDVSEGIT